MNDNYTFQEKVLSGIIWKFMEKAGMQIAQFIIQLILARLLLPEDYGLIGLLNIFILVSDVFIQQGFTTGLIQKKRADELDFSSVFYVNIIMALFIYFILYLASPWIASFYQEKRLINITRILSLNIVFGSFSAVHNAILTKKLDFKKSFIRNAFNIITQGIVGIILAMLGFGVWALVLSKIFGTIVGTCVLVLTVNWKPKLLFSMNRINSLFKYSSKVLSTNLLNTIFNNVHSLIIGKYFTSLDLGFYQRGQQIPQTLMNVIDGSLNEVLYPTLSIVQENKIKLKNTLRKSMSISMFICAPLMLGLLVISKDLTLVLLTEKWLESVPYMQLACIVCLFFPFSARMHALNAIGRSDITFKISIISKTVTLISIFSFINFGIYAIMYATIFSSCILVGLVSYYVKKYIDYTYKELLFDVIPSFLICLIMLVFINLINFFSLKVILKLLLQIVVGMIVYITFSFVFKVKSLKYIVKWIYNFSKKGRIK